MVGHRDNAISPSLYRDEEVFEAEMERVFGGPVWTLVAHASELPDVGDFKTHVIGQVPVVVVRAGEDEFRVLVNSCAHRGAQVVPHGRGNMRDKGALVCIYHQWKYDVDGRVVSVGRKQGYEELDFVAGDYGLVKARVGVVRGAIFASFSEDAPPLEEYLGGEVDAALEVALGDGDLNYLGVQRVIFNANWKMYVENIYDSYHAVTLHKGLRMMRIKKPGERPDRDHEVRFGHYLTQYEAEAPLRPVLRDMDLFRTSSREQSTHLILNLFPASVISEQIDVLALRYIIPRDTQRTEVQFHIFSRAGESDEVVKNRLWQSANFLGPEGMVNLEDGAALTRMDSGLQAKPITEDPDVSPKQNPPYRTDEAVIRNFYDAYDRLMESGT